VGCLWPPALAEPPETQPAANRLPVRISFGHHSQQVRAFHVEVRSSGRAAILRLKGRDLEAEDSLREGVFEGRAGKGDVDVLECVLEYPQAQPKDIANLNNIWRDLIARSDAGTAARLKADAAYRPDDRRLTIQMDRQGTLGFTLTVDQLLAHRSLWIPSLGVYIAVGEQPVPFEQHLSQLEPAQGQRILDQVHREEEASLSQYLAKWEDMGSPAYKHSSQPAPGHIVCLAWDSTMHKFGIDRRAGVWNDYGKSDLFRLMFDFGRLGDDLARTWHGQKLAEGLPVVTTTIQREGVRYEVEQFAYPLAGPPAQRCGDIPMVLLQKVRLTNLREQARSVRFVLTLQRRLPGGSAIKARSVGPGAFVCQDSQTRAILLSVQGSAVQVDFQGGAKPAGREEMASADVAVKLELAPGVSGEVVVRLPSPAVPAADAEKLLAMDHDAARSATTAFWSGLLAQGAQFTVPEPKVNDLFRANLWHALRLPRRHGGPDRNARVDLPYSNFAYDQNGTPWPINQAVYVDYMLYDLRGHHDLSAEELAAMYRGNQEANGRVKGYANWTVYTPGMVYASARHFLLSGDRAGFEALLPQTLRAADWCLAEIARSKSRGQAGGLVLGPLNDLTGEGVWAFSQAYVFAGLDALAAALGRLEHPRAGEFHKVADEFRTSVWQQFAAAMVRSPLVQLRDGTWTPYVPCEARLPGRRMDQWYPTDVDTGALHLVRLGAIPCEGVLADSILHDHEDNLYLKGWGMANEPVYNPQATAYLLRDDAKAAIRAFYSYIACAFSHDALEPVEHRWTHGQYFGPPSTDGAWFELYRNMLLRERDDGSLLLLGASPRAWLADGQRIEIRRAPTYFGPINVTVDSGASGGVIRAIILAEWRTAPKEMIVRLRHPESRRIRSARVNGQDWPHFEAERECVRVANPHEKRYDIAVSY
jgi:hypothetical protein